MKKHPSVFDISPCIPVFCLWTEDRSCYVQESTAPPSERPAKTMVSRIKNRNYVKKKEVSHALLLSKLQSMDCATGQLLCATCF